MTFAEVYRKCRTGWGFLVGLSLTISGWLIFNHFLQFDPDFTRLNLMLSIEASVSVAVLLSTQEAYEKVERALETQTNDIVEKIAEKMNIDV